MFGGKKKPPVAAPPKAAGAGEMMRPDDSRSMPTSAYQGQALSVIAEGLTLQGTIKGNSDVQLDGHFSGDVTCRKLVIGPRGMLSGTIIADELVVMGRVDGNVRAVRVQLTATAVMIGDVAHEILEVAPGASVEGRYSQAALKTDAAGQGDRKAHLKAVGSA